MIWSTVCSFDAYDDIYHDNLEHIKEEGIVYGTLLLQQMWQKAKNSQEK
jgi:hypothetical protein